MSCYVRSRPILAIRTAAGVLACSFLVLLLPFLLYLPTESSVPADAAVRDITFVLDAGHGGEDAGAVGINGALEKELNLSITKILSAYLRSAGFSVIETRTEDKLLYKEEENIRGYRKIYDLKNRLEMAKSYPDAVFVSIHMNTFPEERYAGLQIYYSQNTSGSRTLALHLQNEVASRMQPENHRAIKPASDNIYLLSRAEGTAILIECGFLSNRAECEKLSSEDYRKELSFVLFCGMMNDRNRVEG